MTTDISSLANAISNKRHLLRLNAAIAQMESQLNSHMDALAQGILTEHKPTEQMIKLPAIEDKSRISWSQSSSQRNRSISHELSFLAGRTEADEQEMKLFRTMAESSLQFDSAKEKVAGRAVGANKFLKPRIIRPVPEILPKQVRNNPFAAKNAIKAHELGRGMLSLIERGRIGKDVDIITAFERGSKVLDTKKAIMHDGGDKFTPKVESSNPESTQILPPASPTKESLAKYEPNDSWALTMLPGSTIVEESFIEVLPHQQAHQMSFKDLIPLKICNFQVIQDANYQRFRQEQRYQWGQLVQLLKSLCHFCKSIGISLVYANSSKLLNLASLMRRPHSQEFRACLIANHSELNSKSLAKISKQFLKKEKAGEIIRSAIRAYKEHKIFKMRMLRQRIEKRMVLWGRNACLIRTLQKAIKANHHSIQKTFTRIQSQFMVNLESIQNSKHYEIHISNRRSSNTISASEHALGEITRIFKLSNPNTSIIYVLPHEVGHQTINYYYKIMELEEIARFRERVTFIHVDPLQKLPAWLPLSSKLYYCVESMKMLRARIREEKAYFVISYPAITDAAMVASTGIPQLGCSPQIRELFEPRHILQDQFGCDTLSHLRVDANSMRPHSFLTALNQFSVSGKRCFKFICKINGTHHSQGIGLICTPFSTVSQLYHSTSFISPRLKKTPAEFYELLCKKGGIVQRYEEQIDTVAVAATISHDGKFEVEGTFDRISRGFSVVGWLFPQQTVPHQALVEQTSKVLSRLSSLGVRGPVEATFVVDAKRKIYLEQVQAYHTAVSCSLSYFKFLCGGYFNSVGTYLAKPLDAAQDSDTQLARLEPRYFCHIPLILHSGLTDKQVACFFQLCRSNGISFDLETKHGLTYILLGSLKWSVGMLTVGNDSQGSVKLMLKGLDFLLKQNSLNNSTEFLERKAAIANERCGLMSLKECLDIF